MKKILLFASLIALNGCSEDYPSKELWSCAIPAVNGKTVISIDYKENYGRILAGKNEYEAPISVSGAVVSLLFGKDGQMDLERISKDRVQIWSREDEEGPMAKEGTCQLVELDKILENR